MVSTRAGARVVSQSCHRQSAGRSTNGNGQPALIGANASRMLSTVVYPRVREIIENVVASGLIYVNSHAVDFKTPEIRPYLDKYLCGSFGMDAEERVKIMRLLWDAIGTEFGTRHELYERNYAGNYENIRLENLLSAQGAGLDKELIKFAEQCMDENDLDGWKTPDLINPVDVNKFMS